MTGTQSRVRRGAMIIAVVSVSIALRREVRAEQITFSRITTNSSTVIPAGQIYADVVNTSSTEVTFVFHNNVGVQSSVTDIFADNTAAVLASLLTVTNSDANVDNDVSFVSGNGSPPALPGANNASPPFNGTAALGAAASHGGGGVVEHGLDESDDSVQLLYSLQSGKHFSDVTSALTTGSLRFGLHVQSIGVDGLSDSYVSNPEPSTTVLFGLGAISLLAYTWRWRRQLTYQQYRAA